jgi:integrase
LTAQPAIRYSASQGGVYMAGSIGTYQKCPGCGAAFPPSKGGFPIVCPSGCQTQPTKFFIKTYWKGKDYTLYYDRSGKTLHHFPQAVATIGDIRGRMAAHKDGKGFFDPNEYKKQSSTSFQAFWDRFLKKYKGATKDKVGAIGRHHLTYFLEMQMRDIVSWHVDEWWDALEEKELSPAYMNDIHVWVKSFFRRAKDLDVIDKMPIFPKPPSVPEPEVEDFWSEGEQLAVLGALPEHDRPIYDFLFLTGCRVNEATGLQRVDVDRKNKAIIIKHTRKRDGSLGIVKTKKRRRISYRLAPDLKECLKVSNLLSPFQFLNKWGRPYTDDYLRDTIYTICDQMGIKRIKLKNASRHSFGMGLVSKGFDAWQISKAFEHSSVRMTEHYIKMAESEKDKMYGRGSVVPVETLSTQKKANDK